MIRNVSLTTGKHKYILVRTHIVSVTMTNAQLYVAYANTTTVSFYHKLYGLLHLVLCNDSHF